MFYMLICNQVTLNLTLLLTWHFGNHCYNWQVNRVMSWPIPGCMTYFPTLAVATQGLSLLNSTPTPPYELCDFVHQTITGRQGSTVSDRVRRVGASLAADICVAATNGKWIMPKHLLLSMALRHLLLSMALRQLIGSAQVLTIINRFGHGQSYTKVLEIETAIGTLIQTRDSLLPSNISRRGNIVAQLCWDNFDVTEQMRSGLGTTHSTLAWVCDICKLPGYLYLHVCHMFLWHTSVLPFCIKNTQTMVKHALLLTPHILFVLFHISQSSCDVVCVHWRQLHNFIALELSYVHNWYAFQVSFLT